MRAPVPPAFPPRFTCVPGPPAFLPRRPTCVPAPPAHLRSRLTVPRSISTAATSPSPPALSSASPSLAPSPLHCYPARGGESVPNCLSFEGYVRLFVL